MNGGLERKGVEKRDPSGRLIPGNGKGRGAHPLKTTKDAAPPLRTKRVAHPPQDR